MKYTKTYDKFLSSLFKKKTPTELDTFADTLKDILEYHIENVINENWEVLRDKQLTVNVINIYIDPKDLGSDVKIIGLYYNEELNRIMYVFVSKKLNFLDDIKDFLDNIMKSFSDKITQSGDEIRFFIPLDKISDIINEITIEKYNEFLHIKKYNL